MINLLEISLAPGDACAFGCKPEDLARWIDTARQLAPWKRVVAASAWQWWDLDYSEDCIAATRKLGLKPVRLWVGEVISDTSDHWQPGNWVLTSELQQLHHECIFETRNSLYLMVGPGTRKKIDPKFAQSIFA